MPVPWAIPMDTVPGTMGTMARVSDCEALATVTPSDSLYTASSVYPTAPLQPLLASKMVWPRRNWPFVTPMT